MYRWVSSSQFSQDGHQKPPPSVGGVPISSPIAGWPQIGHPTFSGPPPYRLASPCPSHCAKKDWAGVSDVGAVVSWRWRRARLPLIVCSFSHGRGGGLGGFRGLVSYQLYVLFVNGTYT